MKKVVAFVLASLLSVGILYAKEDSIKNYNMDSFIGSWKYSETIQDKDPLISVQSIDTYKNDGSLISKGDIKMYDINKTLIAHTNVEFIEKWSVAGSKYTEQVIECKRDEILKVKDPMDNMLLNMILSTICDRQTKMTHKIIQVSEDTIILEFLNERTKLIRVKPLLVQ